MIDIIDIKGKKFIFIDENAFGMSPDFFDAQREKEDGDVHPGLQIRIDFSSFKKPERLGERIAF